MILGIVMLSDASVVNIDSVIHDYPNAPGVLTLIAVFPLLTPLIFGKGCFGTFAIVGIVIASRFNRLNFWTLSDHVVHFD